jgi:hypothetical protein
MTQLRDPGMDIPPEQWSSPEYDPGFPEIVPNPTPDNDRNPTGVIPTLDAAKMHEDVVGGLRAILHALTDRSPTLFFALTTTRASTHIRMRGDLLVITVDAAAQVTVNIGSGTYIFNFPAADIRIIPFPLVIERGVDVFLSTSAGNLGACYLIATPE